MSRPDQKAAVAVAAPVASTPPAADPTRVVELSEPLELELGGTLPVRIAFRTWGTLSPAGDNAVVVCHALTGSADVDAWWPALMGAGRCLDPAKDFVICANVLGSCYGTTGPASLDPRTGQPYGPDFPRVTIRDMVRAQAELVRGLGVQRIRTVLGGSMGGMQALEWALLEPDLVESLVVIASTARHTPWAIALSEAQRYAIYADPKWQGGRYPADDPPAAGLAAARMMAMCMYRSSPSFQARFGRERGASAAFSVEEYLRHQGEKIVRRFDANTYLALTWAMDTHDVGRDRGSLEAALQRIEQPSLVVSIPSDVLYWPAEQREMAELMPRATFAELASPHGHDGFLIETEALDRTVADFRREQDAPAEVVPLRGKKTLRPAALASAAPSATVAATAASLLVLGKGTVGSALLGQIREQHAALERIHGAALRVCGVADSRRALFDRAGIDLATWQHDLAGAPELSAEARLELLDRLADMPTPVLVDCTGADGMPALYAEALGRGIHVVAANKKPFAAPWKEREHVFAKARAARRELRYETTVGASLPVIDTLKDLVRTGDRILRIEGAFSGTLGFICDEISRGVPLSLAVRRARDRGFTEPNPQDDLSGADVARKALILARELGYELDMAQVTVEPMVSARLLEPMAVDDFLEALTTKDESTTAWVQAERAQGKVLRYLARIDIEAGAARPTVRVGPTAVELEHPAARLRGGEAFIAFTTERYRMYPLVVQGVGAGGPVTAAGVLADVLKIV
jgi:homoserine O-acetyltransferase